MVAHKGSTAWRWAVVGGVLALAAAPALMLGAATLGEPSDRAVWTRSFAAAVASSLGVGMGVAVVSLAVGLPLGLVSALYRFRGRIALVAVQALPLLLPSFLPAIGWSNLAATGRFPWFPWPTGLFGCVFVLAMAAVPLPLLATWAACRNLTASQLDAARLDGGERAVLVLSAGAGAPVAVLAALLAGILSLSDAGAPLILGCRSVAVEIRTSFSAFYDYDLARRQCLAVAGLVLALTAPLLIVGLRRIAAAVLARQTAPGAPYPHRRLGRVAQVGLIGLTAVSIGLPTLGLCLPVIHNPMLGRAAEKAGATAGASLVYSVGAGLIAVLLASGVALATAGDFRLRLTTLGLLLALVALPPGVAGLGISRTATFAPPELDWLVRSELTVALVLGLRFLPVATLAMMRGVGSLSPSWSDAARVHGVGPARLLCRVTLPILKPAMLIALLLVTVLAAGDVTTTHLLEPPGRPSLAVGIFTVMANSPEGLVASLCLFYLVAVVGLLGLFALLLRWGARRIS